MEIFDKIIALPYLIDCLLSWIAMEEHYGPVQRGEISDYGDCI